MARETAQQRRERKELERAARSHTEFLARQEFVKNWPTLLNQLVQEAFSLGTVNIDMTFFNADPYDKYKPYSESKAFIKLKFGYLPTAWFNDYEDREVWLPLDAAIANSDQVEYAVEAMREEKARREEEIRVANIRAAALAKLTDEEKKVLNVR